MEDKSLDVPHKKHHEPAPPPPPKPKDSAAKEAPSEDYLWERRFELQHRVLTNLLYQQKRRHILESRDRLSKLVALLASSIVFAQLAPLADYFSLFAALACAGSLVAFVFSFASRAQDASERQAQWAELNQQIEGTHWRRVDVDTLERWFGKACAIEAGEAAPNPAVLRTCGARASRVLKALPANQCSIAIPWPAMLRFIP